MYRLLSSINTGISRHDCPQNESETMDETTVSDAKRPETTYIWIYKQT